jgi:hypothetical protein
MQRIETNAVQTRVQHSMKYMERLELVPNVVSVPF